MGKLAGTLFVYNGNKFDYCFKESIQCLLEFCDYVIVAAGGDDNTLNDVLEIKSDKLKVIEITQSHWDSQHGKEKLNYFTNICITEAEKLGYEYQFNLQADEILHEKSYSEIREAIETVSDGYMCTRINLWQSPYLQLNVPQERKPCNTSVIRLAKTKFLSVDDAENIGVPFVNYFFENEIQIWHYGFVRKKEVMKSKIINMQEVVFLTDHDKKLDNSDIFDSTLWFSGSDLKIIDYPHPKIMKEWILGRP